MVRKIGNSIYRILKSGQLGEKVQVAGPDVLAGGVVLLLGPLGLLRGHAGALPRVAPDRGVLGRRGEEEEEVSS